MSKQKFFEFEKWEQTWSNCKIALDNLKLNDALTGPKGKKNPRCYTVSAAMQKAFLTTLFLNSKSYLPTQMEIADRIGCSRDSVMRAVEVLERQQLIIVESIPLVSIYPNTKNRTTNINRYGIDWTNVGRMLQEQNNRTATNQSSTVPLPCDAEASRTVHGSKSHSAAHPDTTKNKIKPPPPTSSVVSKFETCPRQEEEVSNKDFPNERGAFRSDDAAHVRAKSHPHGVPLEPTQTSGVPQTVESFAGELLTWETLPAVLKSCGIECSPRKLALQLQERSESLSWIGNVLRDWHASRHTFKEPGGFLRNWLKDGEPPGRVLSAEDAEAKKQHDDQQQARQAAKAREEDRPHFGHALQIQAQCLRAGHDRRRYESELRKWVAPFFLNRHITELIAQYPGPSRQPAP